MRLEKKDWISPRTGFQEFVPNEYCAPCGDGTTMVTYYFWCDAGAGDYKVWLDSNNNGELDQGIDTNITRNGTYSPCNESHTVTVPKGQSIDSTFPKGFMKATYMGYVYGEAIPVRIWRGEDGKNVHCTTHLDESEFTPHNPS